MLSGRRSDRTFSLRAHLLLLVLGTMVPALVVAAVLVRRVVADNRQSVETQLLDSARSSAAVVDAELGGTIRALQGLAESDRLSAGDLAGFYEQAKRLQATQPTWTAVSLSTPDGRQILNTSRPLGGEMPTIADRESFETALKRKPAIGTLHVGRLTQSLGFLVRVPVERNGDVRYVVSVWITARAFASILEHQTPVADEAVRGVVDASGVVVARSKEPERFVGQKGTAGFLRRFEAEHEGVYRDQTLEGLQVYGAFSRAPLSGWIAGVAVPAAVVDGSFQQSMAALIGLGLLLLAAGSGATYVISRRISRDIGRSAAQAEAIAGGHRPEPPRSSVTEVQRLVDALDRSAVLLEVRQRERDEQVANADRARAAAEAADRAKDEFLAMLGHELRNPLAPALTALQIMKQRGMAEFTRERDVVERQIRHMARLVDDLLDVARLRRGAIELRRERVDLAEIVARAVEMTSPALTDKHHRLEVDVPSGLVIDADKIRIAQVLSNILSNAAKYTEPNGAISVRARQAGKRGRDRVRGQRHRNLPRAPAAHLRSVRAGPFGPRSPAGRTRPGAGGRADARRPARRYD